MLPLQYHITRPTNISHCVALGAPKKVTRNYMQQLIHVIIETVLLIFFLIIKILKGKYWIFCTFLILIVRCGALRICRNDARPATQILSCRSIKNLSEEY